MDKNLKLSEILALEQIGENDYQGVSWHDNPGQIYGGQVLGQSLLAASQTVEDRAYAHSLHAYFLRPGDTSLPVLYRVEPIRNGRSFQSRKILALQKNRVIFQAQASFHIDAQDHRGTQEELHHQIEMPLKPAPETLPSYSERIRQQAEEAGADTGIFDQFMNQRHIEIRAIKAANPFSGEAAPPEQECWMRTMEKLPDDPKLHQCALAFISDWSLIDTSMYPHGVPWFADNVQTVSLDHAIWFHEPCRADAWLLFLQDSPHASGGRGFSRGLIFNQSGALVASTAQEGLIRIPG